MELLVSEVAWCCVVSSPGCRALCCVRCCCRLLHLLLCCPWSLVVVVEGWEAARESVHVRVRPMLLRKRRMMWMLRM